MKLKELEKRLASEPNNLGLRVTVAGMLHAAGRTAEAVALYRSVALAYRAQGRVQQAIAVCRSVLELAPDEACRALLAELAPPPTPPPPLPPTSPPPPRTPVTAPAPAAAPAPAPSFAPAIPISEDTPLPHPVPHHVFDPTSRPTRVDLDDATRPDPEPRPQLTGLAQAARRISGLIAGDPDEPELDLAAELETRKRPRVDPRTLARLSSTALITPIPADGAPTGPGAPEDPTAEPTRPRDSEEEVTWPRRGDPDK